MSRKQECNVFETIEEDIRRHFPSSIAFPDELAMLCDWLNKFGYPISGHFELRAGDGEGRLPD